MASASAPKRIHFAGSDGHTYRFLAKPQDDLRRDMRVMEYGSLLNRLFGGAAATRQRHVRVSCLVAGAPLHQLCDLLRELVVTEGGLHKTSRLHEIQMLQRSCSTAGVWPGTAMSCLQQSATHKAALHYYTCRSAHCCVQLQTFMCLPLGDRGGLVEWVLNTRTYNSILKDTYTAAGVPTEKISPAKAKPAWEAALKLAQNKARPQPRQLLEWYAQKCADAPPVMHQWWLTQCASRAGKRFVTMRLVICSSCWPVWSVIACVARCLLAASCTTLRSVHPHLC